MPSPLPCLPVVPRFHALSALCLCAAELVKLANRNGIPIPFVAFVRVHFQNQLEAKPSCALESKKPRCPGRNGTPSCEETTVGVEEERQFRQQAHPLSRAIAGNDSRS